MLATGVLFAGATSLALLPAQFSTASLVLIAALTLALATAASVVAALLIRAQAADRLERRIEDLEDLSWHLRDSEARYRDLLDSQANLICRRDAGDRLTFVNKAFCRSFGVTAEEVLGSTFAPAILAEDAGGADASAANRSVVKLVETTSGPRWYAIERNVVPGATLDSETGTSEIQLIGRDITEEREFQAALAEARDQAQAADRAKSRFLAAMSHEIRTPMNGIIGMSLLLSETKLNEEQATYNGAIEQSARTLMQLIDEILDFSKIEAGKLVINEAPLGLHNCVQAAIELVAPAAHEKGLEFAWTIDPALPSVIIGDESRLRQILLNLLSNAVKFTDRGGVLLTVSKDGGAGAPRLVISVKDTGIGLAPESISALFAEFAQADGPLAQRRGGTGLGLAISQRLARAMDGSIAVESRPDRGANFTLSLPLRAAPAAEGLPILSRPDIRGTVLLAFDRLIERRALSTSLRSVGLRGLEADDLASNREIDLAAAAGRPVEIVIADADGDIAEAAKLLATARSRAGTNSVHGIILIDAVAKPALHEYRAAGFETYLMRPVRPVSLMTRLEVLSSQHKSALTREADKTDPQPARPAGTSTGYRALLAEDNAINALLARKMLENAGCHVVHVADGEQAVSALSRCLSGQDPAFDIVLMDVHMPRMDGLAAVGTIRRIAEQNPGAPGRVPPLVALTANAFAEDRQRCIEAGFDDYLAKPFHKQEIIELLERWCRTPDRHRARTSAA
ncbi:MAG: ATP-binding protein [Hyphomicrobiaceae bacterium]